MLKVTPTFDHVYTFTTQKNFEKVATIVVAVTTSVVDQISTIVVFCKNCDWCCDICGWLRQLWTLLQLWLHQGPQLNQDKLFWKLPSL